MPKSLVPLLVLFVLVIPCGLLVAVIASKSSGTAPQPPVAPGCRSDWRECVDNADLVSHYSGFSNAQTACQMAATEKAQYGEPKWPWFSFSHFDLGTDYPRTGIATLYEPEAQFENQYGAMERHLQVTCVYDLQAKQVDSIAIEGRGLFVLHSPTPPPTDTKPVPSLDEQLKQMQAAIDAAPPPLVKQADVDCDARTQTMTVKMQLPDNYAPGGLDSDSERLCGFYPLKVVERLRGEPATTIQTSSKEEEPDYEDVGYLHRENVECFAISSSMSILPGTYYGYDRPGDLTGLGKRFCGFEPVVIGEKDPGKTFFRNSIGELISPPDLFINKHRVKR